MSKSSEAFITVFIPTFNGEKYLAESIEAVLNQELPKNYKLELLIIDSGSSDKSLDIIDAYKDRLTFLQIPNSEFSHGGTRAKAANIAKGEYILFLTQDATPTNHRWIINMIEPFFISDKVGCVFGRQVPRRNAVATIKREIATVFGQLGAPDSIILHREKSLVDLHVMNDLNTFFSDVNSAIRKDLIEKVPFRNVKYAEDQALAADMQNNGYLKAYTPSGSVWHSNEYTVREFYKRKFDEFIGLQESVDYKIKASIKSLLLGWVRPTLQDWKFINKDSDYSSKTKLKYYLLSIGYNYMSGLGRYNSVKYLNDPARRSKISLEESKKYK